MCPLLMRPPPPNPRILFSLTQITPTVRWPLISSTAAFIKPAPSIFMGSFFSTSNSSTMSYPVQKSNSEWQTVLSRGMVPRTFLSLNPESGLSANGSPEQFRVLREKGTESPGTGEYNKHIASGVYTCAGCDAPLYKSTTKFNSGCGWPAFFEGIPGAIVRHEDRSLGSTRTEIVCKNCGGHLG